MLDWANARGIGFSHFVSLGDSADVDFGDVLDYLASDPGTRAILMYIESIKAARKFMSAARAAARNKPVIVVKAGRAPAGRQGRGVAHRRAGRLGHRCSTRRSGAPACCASTRCEELFDAAETLARVEPLARRAAGDPDQRRRRRRAGGRRAGAGRRPLAELGAATCRRWTPCCRPPGRAPIRSTSSATRRSSATPQRCACCWRRPRSTACCSCTRPRRSCPAARSRPRACRLIRQSAKPVLACWLGGASGRGRAPRSSARPASPTTTRPSARWPAGCSVRTYRRNQEALLQLPTAALDDFRPDLARPQASAGPGAARRPRVAGRGAGQAAAAGLWHSHCRRREGRTTPRRRSLPRRASVFRWR